MLGWDMSRMRSGTGYVLAALMALAVSGCATYGEQTAQSEQKVSQEKYQAAQTSLKEALQHKSDDQLLYHLEVAAIQHMAGKYRASNRTLAEADRLVEKYRGKDASEQLESLMSSPRQRPYKGRRFERVYINYYAAMNYLALARGADSADAKSHLESARVELQQVRIQLNKISQEEISYQEAEKKQEKLFTQLVDVFGQFKSASAPDESALAYRGDAYLRYQLAALYEKRGELDNARLQYRRAAELYERGYADQYGLSDAMAERAWFDALLMMKVQGGYSSRVARLSQEKLDADRRKRLAKQAEAYQQRGHVIAIQTVGSIPKPKQLNLYVEALPSQRALRISPITGGEPAERRAQRAWFTLLYGDSGALGLMKEISLGGIEGAIDFVPDRTIPLGPSWDLAEQVGLIAAIGDVGLRATVPYYQLPYDPAFDGLQIRIDDGAQRSMHQAESLWQLAVQEQLRTAGQDLQMALARTSVKNLLADKTGDAASGSAGLFLELAGRVTAAASSQAETRTWSLLPANIYVARFAVAPGKHEVTVAGQKDGGEARRTTRPVNVDGGDVAIVKDRFFVP